MKRERFSKHPTLASDGQNPKKVGFKLKATRPGRKMRRGNGGGGGEVDVREGGI